MPQTSTTADSQRNLEAQKYEKFFLEAQESFQASDRTPLRFASSFKPLVDGVNTFQEMEKSIFEAKESVYLAFWAFDPYMPVTTKGVRGVAIPNVGRNISSWIDLICYKLTEKIPVYFYINDHDPVLLNHLHLATWETYLTLVREAQALSNDAQKCMHLLTAYHSQTSSLIPSLSSKYLDVLEHHLNILNQLLASQNTSSKAMYRFENSPGLWPYIQYNGEEGVFEKSSKIIKTMFPASSHQKYCIIDENILIIGGLDPFRNRYDSQVHSLQRIPWHDVNCRVEGEIVQDALRNFIYIWNEQLPRFLNFVQESNRLNRIFTIETLPVSSLAEYTPKKRPLQKTGLQIPVQIVRTLSRGGMHPLLPSTVLTDTFEAYVRAIQGAEKYIYIENQFFRSVRLADEIINQYKRSGFSLKVIIVLPHFPEENQDFFTLHGMHLQFEALDKLKKALGPNVGFYRIFRQADILVHSKVMIIDDQFALIGSANINERSFQTDNEIGISLYSENKVKAFRIQLWNEHLGHPRKIDFWTSDQFINEWNNIAMPNNYVLQPGFQKGNVLPFDHAENPGEKSYLVPDALTEWTQEDKNVAYT